MMNRIGTDHFSVEFLLDARTNVPEIDEWLNGRLRFVVNGHPIGDESRSVSLNAGTVAVRELLSNRGRRANRALMSQPRQAVFQTVFGALYEDSGQTDEQIEHDWATYSVLLGVPKGFEAFDGWQAFLLEDASRARYIWRRTAVESSPIHEEALRPGEFDVVLESFLNEMRRLAPNVVK